MLFSSLTFLCVFLPGLLILYFLFNNIKYKNTILFIFSLFFYAWGEPIYVLLMLASITITYIFGIIIDKSQNHKKLFLSIAIILLLLSLLYFKYANFLIDNINTLFKINIHNVNLSLPIGISFYTFQAISYLIDLYRGNNKVQKNYLNMGLYITLFPQLIAGPIVRYKTIEEEIGNRTVDFTKFIKGLQRFIIGLSKKVIIANNVSIIADTIFNSSINGTALLWLGALCYTLQIYYDFSGYSDMAIGLGKMFGFTFLENFNYPYISKSIKDFWSRWHISLSSWFKDYVYIPLGGSRTTILKNIRNIIVVWMLTGLWHGASWNFVIWGLYYCTFLLIEKFIIKDKINKIPGFIRHIVTMIIVVVGWVIFRITDISNLLIIIKNMFVYKHSDISGFIFDNISLGSKFLFIIPGLIFCFPIKIKENKFTKVLLSVALLVLYVICIVYLISSTYNPFIYFRF